MMALVSTIRLLAGIAPALLLVAGALLLMLVALPLSRERRDFALLGVRGLVDLACALVGTDPGNSECGPRQRTINS